MFRLCYNLRDKMYIKYFDDFENLYYFVNLGLIVNSSFYVIKIYDVKNSEVFYENK